MTGQPVCGKAYHRRGNGNGWYRPVVDTPLGYQCIGEKTKQRPIGVAAKGVDGIQYALAVNKLKEQHAQDEHHRHAHMHPLPQPLVIGLATHIHAEACSHGGERAVGT